MVPSNRSQPLTFKARGPAAFAALPLITLREIGHFYACICKAIICLMTSIEAWHMLTMPSVLPRSHAMTTEEQLIKRYGPLLSLIDLSELLKRSPDGLRIALRSQTDFAVRWSAAKRKVGRRVYFRASDVAVLIDAS